MWLWKSELMELGFKRKSDGYWQSARRFGLRGDEHVSAFVRDEQEVISKSDHRRCGLLVELSDLHVTFPTGENIHFYYHETTDGEWSPAGFTSGAEIRRLGLELGPLRDRADRAAGEIIATLGGTLRPR